MFESRSTESQQDSWIETRLGRRQQPAPFYRKLDETLDSVGSTACIRGICRPAYEDASRGGRPGLDPAVHINMLMIDFENLLSERAIASRCAGSLSLLTFLD